MLFLTFTVDKIKTGNNTYKYILHGHTHGSVLFFDLDQLGKYSELIHPNIGDIVEIDFPDENNREKYEITDCFDKQLTQDGINPLLHKYIWKCKARRYVNSYEDGAPADNEADSRLVERNEYDAAVQEQVAEAVSKYDTITDDTDIKQDAVYGGYDGVVDRYDKQETTIKHVKYEFIDGAQYIDIMRFGCGSALITDGYDLIFVTAGGDAYVIASKRIEPVTNLCTFESGTRWLKASDQQVVFIDVTGESCILAVDENATGGNLEISIDDLYVSTAD